MEDEARDRDKARPRAVIFDLGNTLVSYFSSAEWPGVLDEAIEEVAACLRDRGPLRVDPAEIAKRVQAQRGVNTDDLRVRPLLGRLRTIFALSEADTSGNLGDRLCRRFMAPIFSRARLHEDVLPALAELRRRGLKTGILSNTPWGSPSRLWREELARHGLDRGVDEAIFCEDVGWRKPDARPFRCILQHLGVTAEESVFVGDDPRWDIAGPQGIGMPAVLIDRAGDGTHEDEKPIRNLRELLDRF